MVSLAYRGTEEHFIFPHLNFNSENIYQYADVTAFEKAKPRDLCCDCISVGSTVRVCNKTKCTKARQEKRFKPFKFLLTTWKNSQTEGSFNKTQVPVPRDHLFFTTVRRDTVGMPRRPPSSNNSFIVRISEMNEFFKLTEDSVIQDFLRSDNCKRVADKYLISMVFAYFKRANFTVKEYTRLNFFLGLYLACDVEEDEEEIKYEIFPWVLGMAWKNQYPGFLRMRDCLLRKIDYKAIISRRCCDEIMAIQPDNVLWKRERPLHHSGAIRNYMKDPEEDGPRGPHASPRLCAECETTNSQYNSASPASTSWFISSQESSPDLDENEDGDNSLEQDNNKIWPQVEE